MIAWGVGRSIWIAGSYRSHLFRTNARPLLNRHAVVRYKSPAVFGVRLTNPNPNCRLHEANITINSCVVLCP